MQVSRTYVFGAWSLHNIVITNLVWCMAYKREVGEGLVCYSIVVQ